MELFGSQLDPPLGSSWAPLGSPRGPTMQQSIKICSMFSSFRLCLLEMPKTIHGGPKRAPRRPQAGPETSPRWPQDNPNRIQADSRLSKRKRNGGFERACQRLKVFKAHFLPRPFDSAFCFLLAFLQLLLQPPPTSPRGPWDPSDPPPKPPGGGQEGSTRAPRGVN